MPLRDPTGRLAQWALTLQGYDFTIQYRSGKDHGNVDALSRRVHTISQQLILPQTSTEELCNAQNRDDKLQSLIRYLQVGTLPKDTATAEKILRQEGQYFLSDNNVLYRQSPTGERAAIHLVVPKTLQTELLHWCHDHFTSGHLGLTKHTNASDPHTFGTICLQTSIDGSNLAFLVPKRKGMFTIPNHFCCPLLFLVHEKLLPQTVWALFLPRT